MGEDPSETEALLEALRPLTGKPLIVKLTPNVAAPEAVAVAAEEGGADAVSLINTLKASAIDPGTGAPALAAGHGGLSGPAVKPVALQQVRAVRAAVELPIVGMGGISSGADAAEFFAAGADLVAVGTESFRDPRAGSRIANELETGVSETARTPGGARPRVEVETNFGAIAPPRLARPLSRGYTRRLSMTASSVKSSLAAPERSLDQRMEALKRANDIRTARAKLKKDLKAGRASIQTILLDPPEYLLTAKVFDMLLAVPKYGRVKTNRILNQCRISPSKTIGGLSERQRAELISQLRR